MHRQQGAKEKCDGGVVHTKDTPNTIRKQRRRKASIKHACRLLPLDMQYTTPLLKNKASTNIYLNRMALDLARTNITTGFKWENQFLKLQIPMWKILIVNAYKSTLSTVPIY